MRGLQSKVMVDERALQVVHAQLVLQDLLLLLQLGLAKNHRN